MQVCNGNSYLHVSPAELKEAWNRRHLQVQRCSTGPEFTQGRPTNPAAASQSILGSERESAPPQQGIQLTRNLGDTFTFNHINMETLTVGPLDAPIQFEAIPENVFRAVDVFYICQTCGKVFWEGSHFVRVCEQFSHVICGEGNVEGGSKV